LPKQIYFSVDNAIYILYVISMTAREIMKILQDNGWTLNRIRGSHHSFTKEGCRTVTVPFHGNKDIGVLGKDILKQAGINK
jgi:predicted RNA binding protein YcfA (HicA-like mRNA interferase family)